MSSIVKYETDYGPVYIEVGASDERKTGVHKAGLAQDGKALINNATATFESAVQNAFVAANTLVEKATSLKTQPQELNIEFGLKLSGDVNFFVVSGTSEANFAIKVKWVRDATKGTR